MSSFKDKVVYQIYPKSFRDADGDGIGDLRGIIEKLDYLSWLGIDYLWMTPFFVSPQRDNGYDIADYCSIDPRFGRMEDLEELIFQGEKRGIGIMLDMVFNHTSTEHKWFQKALAGEQKYQDYYIFRDGTPDTPPCNWVSKFGGSAWEYVPSLGKWYLHLFDKTQADLNWRNPEAREELKKVIGFWKEKGVKGFRFDVVNLISKPEEFKDDHQGDGRRFYTDGSHVHEYLKELVRDTGIGDMVTVGEMSSTTLENGIRYTDPEEKELSMCFSFHHLKADYKNGEKWEIQPTDYEKLTDILKTWQLGMEKNRGWNAVFWCNHDQPRIVSRLGDETTYWKESAKMLAAMVHMMRGTPYIYQGEELGMTNAHFTDISQYRDVESINYYGIMTGHGKTKEEALHILNERSRDNGRTPMQWNGEKNAGFSQGQPWISLPAHRENINVEAEIRDETSVLWYYRKLIEIRKKEKAVSLGKIEFLDEKDALIFAYRRVWEEDEIVVYSNLSGEKKKLWDGREEDKRKAEDYEKLLGNYEDMDAFAEGYLRPYESLILKRK